ncbi:MAG: glycosyltransferase family 4 protein [Candidatus Doudnabacteria bacterium]|nr:glycosyltransferase family 4 protein [Candidatus Doudnabacteria bacterium]
MTIGLDLRMLGGGSGISRYISEISQAVLETDKTNKYVLFFRNAQDAKPYERFGRKIIIADIAHYSLAEQLKFSRILRKEKLDLVHFPHFNVPILYRGKFVVTIHDLTHTKFPGRKKSRVFHRLAYNAVLAWAIRKSTAIVAVSESTKKEILEYFSVEPEKIHVVYEGANKSYGVLDKDRAFEFVTNRFKINKPYILYVGVWRRYKNLPNLAAAFDRIKEAGVDAQLVLAGEEDPFYPEIKGDVMNAKHHDDIRLLGRVTDEELNYLYNACSIFVLPSLAEGFGLTALEAAATGVPIACSDIPTLREVMGQGAEYFDPHNVGNMADVIQSILKRPERGEELANLGLKRASLFSWTKSAQETLTVYSKVLNK